MLRRALLPVALASALAGAYAADQPVPPDTPAARQEVITAIKDLEKTLGFHETNNFRAESEKITAYYRCYYTGKLELPASYEELQLKQSNKPECPMDPGKYDIFFYPIEAVANGKTPITASLASAPLERLLMVVPHEDFHEHKEIQKSPASITEAASTLIGFLTASEFALQKFGAASSVYQNLAREPELFLRKAELVNRYYRDLGSLYAAARSGETTRQDAFAQKERFFARLQQECGAISPEPSSFNRCLAVNNNAGLAFDFTYTKHYPLLYEVFLARGQRVRSTVEAVKGALAAGATSEGDAVKTLRDTAASP